MKKRVVNKENFTVGDLNMEDEIDSETAWAQGFFAGAQRANAELFEESEENEEQEENEGEEDEGQE